LYKEDVVTVYSILDFVEEYKVTIDGEIKNPGIYDYHEGLTLNDFLVQAGGLTGSASKRVEIARMISQKESMTLILTKRNCSILTNKQGEF
jgi:protein involved in polysaccharide export with SLBB domain